MHLCKNIQLLKKCKTQQPKKCTSQEPTHTKKKKSWTKCSQLESQNKTRLDTKSPWQHELTNTQQPRKKSTSHSRTCDTRKAPKDEYDWESPACLKKMERRRKERKRDERFQQLQHTLHHHFLLPLHFFNNYY